VFPERQSSRWAARQSRRLADSLRPAVGAQKRAYRRALRRVHRKFSEKTVHEFRVETRRMLALLDLLAPFAKPRLAERDRATLRKGLKRFASLRDTQVMLAELKAVSHDGYLAGSFRKWLKKREARMIARCERKLQRSAADDAGRALTSAARALGRRFEDAGGAAEVFKGLLGRVDAAFAEVVELRQRINRREPATIHRTRLAFKRFRYMAEWLASVMPGVGERHLRKMHDFQGEMGELQDCEVLMARFAKFALKHDVSRTDSDRFCVQVKQRRARLLALFLARADDLYDFWIPPPKRATGNSDEADQALPPAP
jgi:CHAD domain-containing protein